MVRRRREPLSTVRPFEASLMQQPSTEAEVTARAAAVREAAAREKQLQHRLQTAVAVERGLQSAEKESKAAEGRTIFGNYMLGMPKI